MGQLLDLNAYRDRVLAQMTICPMCESPYNPKFQGLVRCHRCGKFGAPCCMPLGVGIVCNWCADALTMSDEK